MRKLLDVILFPFALVVGIPVAIYLYFKREPQEEEQEAISDCGYETTAPLARKLDAIENALYRQKRTINVSNN